jgi:hypothetical protein
VSLFYSLATFAFTIQVRVRGLPADIDTTAKILAHKDAPSDRHSLQNKIFSAVFDREDVWQILGDTQIGLLRTNTITKNFT